MNELRKLLLLVVPALILALAGCGGGGGNASITTTTPNDILAAAGATGQMTVTVASTAGKQVAGLKVTYTNDHPEALQLNSTSQTVGSDGTATVTYVARSVSVDTLCTITAKVDTITSVQTVLVKGTGAPVTPPVPATPFSIAFKSASPPTISMLNSTGVGTSVTSVVTFKVLDTVNNPVSGATVDFSLESSPNGVDLTPKLGVSDNNGLVQTIVTAGTTPGPVTVRATTRGLPPKTALSSVLQVSTGISAQKAFSVSVDNCSPEAWSTDGATVNLTVRMADTFGNPVPPGTAVSFITNYGAVDPYCVTKAVEDGGTPGLCTTTWRSQGVRPVDGKFTVLAYAVGEESFEDSFTPIDYLAQTGPCTPVFWDGVGFVKKCGEFWDIPEAYLDANWNGVKDPGEFSWDYNHDGIYNDTSNTPAVYNGSRQPVGTSAPTSIYNFMNTFLYAASSTPGTINLSSVSVPFGSNAPSTLTVADINNNPMPKGTKIALEVIKGVTTACVNLSDTLFTVGCPGVTSFGLSMTNICSSSGGARDSVKVTVTSPGGAITTKTFALSY